MIVAITAGGDDLLPR